MSQVTLAQAVKQAAGNLPQTVVLYGPESYLKKAGMQQLLRAMRIELPEFNLIRFEGVPDPAMLRTALGKPAFMSPTKAVIVQGTDILSSKAPATQSQPIADMQLAPNTLFILEAGDKLDRRKAFVKHLDKKGLLIECLPLKGDAATQFVRKDAKRRGLHIAATTASTLFERCEGDLYAVSSELEKLGAICSGEITAADLDRFGPSSPDANVFAIQDLFVAHQYEKAAQAVRSLVEREPSPIGLLTMVTNAFKCMLIARTCRDARFAYAKTIALICESAGAKEWSAKRAYERCTKYSADKLRRNIERLADIDFGVKQGEITLQSDLYPLLFELFSPNL